MSATSDIRHRHLLFRYRKKIFPTENCHSDTYRKSSDIDIKVHSDIWYQNIQIHTRSGSNARPLVSHYHSATVLIYEQWDVGYRIKVHTDIRYNVGLRSLQSDIRGFDIRLSPITLIMNIGLSAHI
jgi:hypothetical protein